MKAIDVRPREWEWVHGAPTPEEIAIINHALATISRDLCRVARAVKGKCDCARCAR